MKHSIYNMAGRDHGFFSALVKLIVFCGAISFGVGVANAQPILTWDRVYDESDNREFGNAVAVDSADNIVIAGRFFDVVDYSQSFLLLKYDGNGSLLWSQTHEFQSNSTNELTDIAVDSADNIIVGGWSDDSDGRGYFAKFDPNGVLQWEIGNWGPYAILSVAVDGQDNILVLSRTGDFPRSGPLVVEKYDSDGVFVWRWESVTPPRFELQKMSLAVDSLDNVWAAAPDGSDSHIWKLDSDGNLEATVEYATEPRDIPAGLAIDTHGNVVLATRSSGRVVKFDSELSILYENNGFVATGDLAIGHNGALIVVSNIDPESSDGAVGFDATLDPQWTIDLPGKALEDVVFDSANNIILAGINNYRDLYVAKFASQPIDPDGDGIMAPVDGYMDAGVFVDESHKYSDNFTDINILGTSFGNIKLRSGLRVDVADAESPDDGLLISASGGTGTAQIRVCGLSPPDGRVLLTNGDSIVVTCGSMILEVIKGPVELLLSGDFIEILAETDAVISVSETDDGQVQIENLPGSVEIEIVVDGVSIVLSPEANLLSAAVDILPADDANCLNTRKKGKIPVAIFGSVVVHVQQIDPATCRLEEELRVSTKGKAGTPMASFDDINLDGITDLVIQFETDGDVFDEQTSATVSCDYYSGEVAISGYDAICTVP